MWLCDIQDPDAEAAYDDQASFQTQFQTEDDEGRNCDNHDLDQDVHDPECYPNPGLVYISNVFLVGVIASHFTYQVKTRSADDVPNFGWMALQAYHNDHYHNPY